MAGWMIAALLAAGPHRRMLSPRMRFARSLRARHLNLACSLANRFDDLGHALLPHGSAARLSEVLERRERIPCVRTHPTESFRRSEVLLVSTTRGSAAFSGAADVNLLRVRNT